MVLARLSMAMVVFCLMLGWAQPGSAQSGSAPARPAAASSSTLWTGSFACAQGLTNLKLTMTVVDDHTVQAVFEFGPSSFNPNISPGSFLLTGDPRSPIGNLRLVPVRWISQPTGYAMVGLDGTIQNGIYQGVVTGGYGCNMFSVAKLNTQPGAAVRAPNEVASGLAALSGAEQQTRIALQAQGGILTVPVTINGTITLNFAVDSGAADVTIPANIAATLVRAGALSNADFTGQQIYVLADGTRVPSATFIIRSLQVGNKLVRNVRGGLAAAQGSLLLGQSFLQRFKSWSIDNRTHELVLD